MPSTTPAAIESHVAAVRRKMILQRFVRRFAVTLLVLGAAVWGVALVLRLFAMQPARRAVGLDRRRRRRSRRWWPTSMAVAQRADGARRGRRH